jgi:hypothetical protein
VRLDELQARVAASYDRLGMPSWPNPHPGMAAAREEEYSRVTAPARYGIVHARARVWASRLGEIPGIEVQALAPAPPADRQRRDGFDRGVRITSPRPDTLPLLLLERDVRWPGVEGPLAVLHIGVVEPGIALEVLPDCGCDACDLGSDDLLQAIDQTIGNVLGGPFVALRGNGWQALWHPDGGSSGGTEGSPDHTFLMELCRRLATGEDVQLPGDTQAFVGRPWLS